ncbi:acyl-CoA dehydrogenase family protein [Pseudoduganella umbonata]|uniref:Alkylation response protein AidB-like acyl-CoA dehydrogenase n=1 Tax=Pseudoduganella umbonata TaxID=864828 RepID=A0A4P8HLV5_9BURK|nr:acyl-CoA dehydrogenase family protein [Pseudoduganella umbonata]MBB3221499.1 alkylation response protein AidB-like acyl-CoA dehydrogenase [Pseudoduganella umbonata]QCP10647.1 monooxygenase [Pseudoduganella umbonata]
MNAPEPALQNKQNAAPVAAVFADPLADPLAVAASLAAELAATAVERDAAGGHARHERQLIRASGLLALSIPADFGGHGAGWDTTLQAVRVLARADSALAHVFAFHHLQLAGIQLYGTQQQQRHLLHATVDDGLFWGNALNPLDRRLVATDAKGGFLLDGTKSFASGSVGSDWLTVSAWHEATQTSLIGVLPTGADGIDVRADWDAFGQKQTDSGTVQFHGTLLPVGLVLQQPGQEATPQSTVRSQVAQLIMTNLYVGIAEGAFAAARDYTAGEARPWFASGVARAVDDPFIQHRYGELWTLLRPAVVLADHAGRELERVFRLGSAVTARERGELAIAGAEAKVLAHRAAIEIGSALFELTGARSTSARFGFDRYWRNARVHTLHDPVDYKYRDLGRYALSGTLPEPSPYS